jgi:CheY-like chemotaxis protein
MPSSLIVVTGPPLPGRWSLARAIERRCGARRFVAEPGNVAIRDVERALGTGACVLVDGDLPTARARGELLLLDADERVLVEWHCGQTEAEREAFHRYASRPVCLARTELERYHIDVATREPVDDGEAPAVVRVGPELPLDEQVARVVAMLRAPPAPPALAHDARRVMVVEDDADERATLAEVLEELGFTVELAPDAGVALALLDDVPNVELLISDHRMPGMTGIELTRVLKARHPRVRTVLLTAFGDEDTCREAVQADAVTVLSKPLRVIDLERVIDEAGA